MGTSLLDFEESTCQVQSSEIKPSSAVKDNSVYIIFKMVEMKGKYVRSSAENYDKFLDALGVGIILKKAATATTPEMTVEETDGEWTIKTAKKAGEKSTKSTREFFDDKCVYTIEILDSDIICTQTFTRKTE